MYTSGGLSPSITAAAGFSGGTGGGGGGSLTSLAGRCVALLPDTLRDDVRDVVDAVRRASLAAPAPAPASALGGVWAAEAGSGETAVVAEMHAGGRLKAVLESGSCIVGEELWHVEAPVGLVGGYLR